MIFRVASYRGKYYLIWNNGTVLRWTAKMCGYNANTDTLTKTLWRKSGGVGDPAGAQPVTAGGNTYYFVNHEDAVTAGEQFTYALQQKGVLNVAA